jgi:hypothetical protein
MDFAPSGRGSTTIELPFFGVLASAPASTSSIAQRRLPLRVRTFIDFAVDYTSTVLKPFA